MYPTEYFVLVKIKLCQVIALPKHYLARVCLSANQTCCLDGLSSQLRSTPMSRALERAACDSPCADIVLETQTVPRRVDIYR